MQNGSERNLGGGGCLDANTPYAVSNSWSDRLIICNESIIVMPSNLWETKCDYPIYYDVEINLNGAKET